MSKELRS